MKQLFSITLVLFITIGSLIGQNHSMFMYDKDKLETEMASLNEVENYMLKNPGTTIDQLEKQGQYLTSYIVGSKDNSWKFLLKTESSFFEKIWVGCGPASGSPQAKDQNDMGDYMTACIILGSIVAIVGTVVVIRFLNNFSLDIDI